MKHLGHTYGGFVSAISEQGMTSGPSLKTPSAPQAPHQRRELPRPPCRHPRLLLYSTNVAPRRSVCAAMEPPAPVSPFLPESPQISPTRHLLPLATTATHLITDRCRNHPALPALCAMELSSPALGLGTKSPCGLGYHKSGRLNASVGQAHCYSGIFLLPFD
jgi:hypothetical protein